MILLALDTSTPTARVALLGPDGACLASAERAAVKPSSAVLALVDETLARARLRVTDLGAIACGAGPGSFTGLRVGLSIAKGLAMPQDLPLLLVSSLEALAHDLDAAPGTLLVPCLDAGKEQVYARLYRAGAQGERTPESDDLTIAPAALADRLRDAGPVVIGGTGADRYAPVLGPAVRAQAPGPSALAVARLARRRLDRGERDDLARAVPSYGRPPDITKPKPRPAA